MLNEDAPEVVGSHPNIFLHIGLRIYSCSLEENYMFLFLFILQTHTVEGLWISCIMSKLSSFDILALCRKCWARDGYFCFEAEVELEAEVSVDLVWEGWKDRKQEDCDGKQYRNISHYKLFAFSFFHLKEWWGQ